MNILIVGGDGFCGWPVSLELKSRGHDVVIVDNFSRRRIDDELGANSITEIKSLKSRLSTAKEHVGEIHFEYLDIAHEYHELVRVLKYYSIDTIIHFGELKSAPYSMIDSTHMRITVDNNVNGTTNILTAIVEVNPNIHLVHLGTMGVYGYHDAYGKIPEGYLDVTVNSTGQKTSILFPTDPGSVYHMTKSIDQILFYYYNKNWDIKITDLHQGIVWGTQTRMTKKHDDFVNRFDYDGVYGTVLNRFLVQSAINHPLTVHGTGGQTRAFIHIEDTVNCICLAVEDTPSTDNVRIFNQTSEVLNIKELAELIANKTGVEIIYQENPRNELEGNRLEVENAGLLSLGHAPMTLNDHLLDDVYFIVAQYKHNINKEQITARVLWK